MYISVSIVVFNHFYFLLLLFYSVNITFHRCGINKVSSKLKKLDNSSHYVNVAVLHHVKYFFRMVDAVVFLGNCQQADTKSNYQEGT